MVRDGFFYAIGFGVVAVLLWLLTPLHVLVVVPILLAGFFLWFFRDPTRTIPNKPGQVVSPGDGLVTATDVIETPEGRRLRLSIFLNVFNVHVNRAPIAGVVQRVDYHKGGFLNAMNAQSALTNEQTMVLIDAGGYQVAYKQIAGLLARRIVCTVKEGQRVARGERVGLIKFGSRVDVILPAHAELAVKIGMKVQGGSTVLAVVPEAPVAACETVSA